MFGVILCRVTGGVLDMELAVVVKRRLRIEDLDQDVRGVMQDVAVAALLLGNEEFNERKVVEEMVRRWPGLYEWPTVNVHRVVGVSLSDYALEVVVI